MEESRRIKMTKRCLKQALLELLAQKPKGKISIKELCDSADVNRSTFYVYYNDIDELLTEIEDEVLERIPLTVHETEKHIGLLSAITKFFEFIKSDNTFRIILFCANNQFTQKLTDYLCKQCISQKNTSLLDEFTVAYRVSGAIGIVERWITEDFPLSPSEFAKFTLSLIAMDTE